MPDQEAAVFSTQSRTPPEPPADDRVDTSETDHQMVEIGRRRRAYRQGAVMEDMETRRI
jgi:hypothetical protein